MNLNQVSLPANDIPASIAFYRKLGLRLIVETETYARFEMPEGDATMSLYAADRAVDRFGVHVYFECTELDHHVGALQKAGIIFETEAADQRWLWREAWLRDPAGNSICLFHAGVNRKHPPWRLDQAYARKDPPS